VSKRKKLFFYSNDAVSFVEAKFYHIKFSVVVAISTIVTLALLLYANNVYGDVLGVGFKTTTELYAENAVLKERVNTLTGRFVNISENLKQLAESDNQLRIAIDLPKIDLETRTLGTGGTSQEEFLGIISGDASELLRNSSLLLSRVEKEVEFQQKSYVDIEHKQKENKKLFASLPAIKPMVGTYSYHSFGIRRDPILGTLRPHDGVDIQNDIGTPVYATGNGIVEFSGPTGSAYGTALEINHSYGYKSWYAHLSKCVVKSGQRVKRGALIAYSGSTGRSTGPHLHYEVRRNGKKQNPVEYFIDDVDYEKIKSQLSKSR